MKKLLLSLVTVLLFVVAFSQDNYTCYRSEIREWKNEEWKVTTAHDDVNIRVFIAPRFIHVEAQQNAYFLLSKDEQIKLDDLSFSGYRYNAYDLRMEKKCVIDVVDLKEVKMSILSITYVEEGLNIRYIFK